MSMLFLSEIILVSTKMMNRSGMGRVLTGAHVHLSLMFSQVLVLWGLLRLSCVFMWTAWILFTLSYLCVFLAELNNGLKKEVSGKDVARIWVNDDMKMRSFSPVNVSLWSGNNSGLAVSFDS